MTDQIRRPRRSQLAVPGSNQKMIEKAAASKADHVFLDLEDAVAPLAKDGARKTVIAALRDLDWGKKTRCVRINDLRTAWCFRDIIEVVSGAREAIDTIMVPKAMDARDIFFVATLLDQLESELGMTKRIGLEVLIEETAGLMNVESICAASPRMESVIFGMGDYSASHGIEASAAGGSSQYPGDVWHYARFRIVMAARAAGIDPIDGPYANFKKLEGYQEECQRAMILGMAGKWAIHPSQIDAALEAFTPPAQQIAKARQMEVAYAQAEAEGLGSVNIGGMMIDAASIRILRNITAKADLFGL